MMLLQFKLIGGESLENEKEKIMIKNGILFLFVI
jgi:hypothetical protein